MISINEVDDGSNRYSCQIFTSIRWFGGFLAMAMVFYAEKLILHKHGQ